MRKLPKGAGHFCRPLHVAMQIGPYLPARSASGSGVWSLRIPRRRRSSCLVCLRTVLSHVAARLAPGQRFAYFLPRPFLLIVRTGRIVTS